MREGWGRWALRQLAQLTLSVAILGGAALGARHLIDTAPETPRGAAEEPVYVVETLRLEPGPLQPEVTAFGSVEARRSVELRALVQGQVIAVHPDLIVGRTVPAGAVLVRIDPFAYDGAVREAEANLAEARAKLAEFRTQFVQGEEARMRAEEQLEISERDLERYRALTARNVTNEQRLDDRALIVSQRRQTLEASVSTLALWRTRIAQQEAAIERLAWRLDEAERARADTALKAPFDAIVRAETVEPGRRVSVNDVIAELYEADALDVRFTLPTEVFGRLTAAAADGDAPLIGRRGALAWRVGEAVVEAPITIDRLGSDVRSDRGGVEMIAAVDAAAGRQVRPGAFVTVTLPDRLFESAVRAPESALYGGAYVFVVVDGRLLRRPVELLAWRGGDVYLRGDLAGAELLVTRLAEAGEGVRVRTLSAGGATEGLDASDASGAAGAAAGGSVATAARGAR